LSSVNERAFKKIKADYNLGLGETDFRLSRFDWSQLTGSTEQRSLQAIERFLRLALYRKRKKKGISIGSFYDDTDSRRCRDTIYYYKFQRLPQLDSEIKIHSEAIEVLKSYYDSQQVHRIIIPNDLEIPEDVDEINSELNPIQLDESNCIEKNEPSPEDRSKEQSFSIFQITKAKMQCYTLYVFLQHLHKSESDEYNKISSSITSTNFDLLSIKNKQTKLESLRDQLNTHRKENNLNKIAEKNIR